MKKGRHLGVARWVLAGAMALGASSAAFAQDEETSDSAGFFGDMSYSVNGYLRLEAASGFGDNKNVNNQGGNPYNSQAVPRTAYLPPALGGLSWGTIPFAVAGVGFADQLERGDFADAPAPSLNYGVIRGDTELQVQFNSHLAFIGRMRALYAPDVIDGFNAHSVDDTQGGIDGGLPDLYRKKRPNFLSYQVEGEKNPNPLEFSGQDYLVYFPAFVLDYSTGPVNVRIGNQSIAWGQSIFFRVFDVANGLDFRRHLILDRELEEFSDKRVPNLSVRTTYQATDTILLDSFVSKFQPTVYPNPGTPYNVIPSQFTVHDRYKDDNFDSKINFGIRLKADYGQWGWQAMVVQRYNPDGTFRWTESGVNKPLSGTLGGIVNTLYNAKLPYSGVGPCDPALCRRYADIGEALAHSPFEASSGGVYTADEWFYYAADARLNGFTGLNASIEDFPGSQDVYATAIDLPARFGGTVSDGEAREQADAELNTFFMAAGGSLRGHIERVYHKETDFGLGVSYVNDSDNDFLNQLIFNLEIQYTPKRNFTNPSLGKDFITKDEYTVSVVMDKWHRMFKSFPGTYMVLQALTKNRSDLVGRYLGGFGGSADEASPGKSGNANYVVFGFLQPFPNKIWAIEFATLLDVDGGILAQPLVQWNLGKGVTLEGFYNYIDGDLYGNHNENLLGTVDYAREVGMRVSYQF